MGFGFGFDTTFGFEQVFIFAVFAIVIVSFIAAATVWSCASPDGNTACWPRAMWGS